MDKTLCQPRPDCKNLSFDSDQISPCNAHTFPGAKITSSGMWPVSVIGHTAHRFMFSAV